jgi:hypothetical protein
VGPSIPGLFHGGEGGRGVECPEAPATLRFLAGGTWESSYSFFGVKSGASEKTLARDLASYQAAELAFGFRGYIIIAWKLAVGTAVLHLLVLPGREMETQSTQTPNFLSENKVKCSESTIC